MYHLPHHCHHQGQHYLQQHPHRNYIVHLRQMDSNLIHHLLHHYHHHYPLHQNNHLRHYLIQLQYFARYHYLGHQECHHCHHLYRHYHQFRLRRYHYAH